MNHYSSNQWKKYREKGFTKFFLTLLVQMIPLAIGFCVFYLIKSETIGGFLVLLSRLLLISTVTTLMLGSLIWLIQEFRYKKKDS